MQRIYCLDTNVLIDSPECIETFRNGSDNKVYVPYSVIMELDRLKRRNDISHVVAQIARNILDDMRFECIRIPGKTYSEESNDTDIIEDVLHLKELMIRTYNDAQYYPIVISNDSFLRVRLKIEGIECQEYTVSKTYTSESQDYTGFIKPDNPPIANCFYWTDEGQMWFEGSEKFIDYENCVWGVKPRHYTQNAAMELMLAKHIDVTSIQSPAGLGKTYISLAAAMQLTLQKPKEFEKIFIIKPVVEIGEKIGFLPGDVDEKLAPYMRGIMDLIYKLHAQRPANALFMESAAGKFELNPKKLEILHIGFVRGMNLENCVVIIDEAQNCSRYEMRALLSRMGQNVKCFVLGDTNQCDHPYLNSANNGLNWVVKKFKGRENYAHIVLNGKKSRGPICDLVLSTGL
jgi:PhoH-like ATPase